MAEPELVADCVQAMQDAVSIPVTVKHRLGLDRSEDYGFVRRFVETLARAGCRTFLVHARNAVLKGLSPKDNREVPRLRHAEVHRLKREFPELEIVLNGGVVGWPQAEAALVHVDGVMLGRTAYHDPTCLDLTTGLTAGGAARRTPIPLHQRSAGRRWATRAHARPLPRPARGAALAAAALGRVAARCERSGTPPRCAGADRGAGRERLLHNRTAHGRHDLRRQSNRPSR
jgi:tRNA-dihydrouridine synthase